MRDTFVKTLLEIAKKDPNVLLVTGDLGFGVLKPFWDELPDQIINVGIAEQNMTGFATGLALEGKIVYTYSIGNFPTLRTLEQIRNDAAYHNANVKIVCVGGGFVYGSLGMSHHATEDIAIMRSLPNVNVYAPGDLVEAKIATEVIYKTKGVCYLRLGRGGEQNIHPIDSPIDINKIVEVKSGQGIAILSTGAIFEEVVDALKELNRIEIFPAVFTVPSLKPIDIASINRILKDYEVIITIEEHNIIGGLGTIVSEMIALDQYIKVKLYKLGINDCYSSIVGNQKYLRNVYGISSKKIVEVVKNEFSKS